MKFSNEIIIIVSIKFSIPDPTTIMTKTAEAAAAPTLRRTARSITMQFSRLTIPAPERPRQTSTRFSRLTSPAHGRRRRTWTADFRSAQLWFFLNRLLPSAICIMSTLTSDHFRQGLTLPTRRTASRFNLTTQFQHDAPDREIWLRILPSDCPQVQPSFFRSLHLPSPTFTTSTSSLALCPRPRQEDRIRTSFIKTATAAITPTLRWISMQLFLQEGPGRATSHLRRYWVRPLIRRPITTSRLVIGPYLHRREVAGLNRLLHNRRDCRCQIRERHQFRTLLWQLQLMFDRRINVWSSVHDKTDNLSIHTWVEWKWVLPLGTWFC
jgi:hypothetical protein